MANPVEDSKKAMKQIQEVLDKLRGDFPDHIEEARFVHDDPLAEKDLAVWVRLKEALDFPGMGVTAQMRIIDQKSQPSTAYDKAKGLWENDEGYKKNVKHLIITITRSYLKGQGSIKVMAPSLLPSEQRKFSPDQKQHGRATIISPRDRFVPLHKSPPPWMGGHPLYPLYDKAYKLTTQEGEADDSQKN